MHREQNREIARRPSKIFMLGYMNGLTVRKKKKSCIDWRDRDQTGKCAACQCDQG